MPKRKNTRKTISSIQRKLANEDKKVSRIESEEKRIEREEKQIVRLEKDIESRVTPKTITKITKKDIFKGVVGATFGIVAHFVFVEGTHIAENVDMLRAVLLMILSYVLLVMLIYRSGFKKVTEHRILHFLPLRATMIYVVTIITIIIVLDLYNFLATGAAQGLVFKQIAVLSLPAAIGAGAADMVGER